MGCLGFLGSFGGFLGVEFTVRDGGCAPVSGCPSAETGSHFPETLSASGIPLPGVLSLHTRSSGDTPAGSVWHIFHNEMFFLSLGQRIWRCGREVTGRGVVVGDWAMAGRVMAGEGYGW